MKSYFLASLLVIMILPSLHISAIAQTTTSGGISEAPTTVPPGTVDPSINERNGTISTEVIQANISNNDSNSTNTTQH